MADYDEFIRKLKQDVLAVTKRECYNEATSG